MAQPLDHPAPFQRTRGTEQVGQARVVWRGDELDGLVACVSRMPGNPIRHSLRKIEVQQVTPQRAHLRLLEDLTLAVANHLEAQAIA